MPWTAKDAKGHSKKADTPKKQKDWARIANDALKRCLADDESTEVCEGRAIRIANAAVAKMGESTSTTRGYFTSGTATVEISALDVGGEKVPVSKLVAVYQEQQGEPGDQGEPGGQGEGSTSGGLAAKSKSGFTEAVAGSLEDYAMSVKDAFRVTFKPDTISSTGEIGLGMWPRDVFQNDPDLGTAVVVRADDGQLYAVEYKKKDEGFEFATRENWRKARLAYVLEGETAEVAEAQFSESASGHAIGLAETQAITGGPRSPLLMDVALIMPGWGNKKDNHYYSREVLTQDAKVFEGVKMYVTDHRQGEKSVKTEVSVVKECPIAFTDDGAPIASVAVHDPDFAEATRNRAKLGTLETLECSILATGRTRKGKAPDGKKGNIVEAITSANSVDWVTKAGAGGHAIALAESNTGGVNMDKEQVKRLLSESDLPQDAQERLVGVEYENEEAVKEAILAEAKAKGGDKPKPVVYLAEAEIKELLEASRLPKQAQGRLIESQYLDAEALKTVIEQERAYIKELTGSGKPFAQGDTAPTDATMSEVDYDAGIDDIFERHGVSVPQREVT